jgi:hypothetical protein
MSAFTYDDWNNIVANYKNKFGVDENTNTTRRFSIGGMFLPPWYNLRYQDVISLHAMAGVWCPAAATSIDSTRTIWSQETLDEVDTVMSGGRCGTSRTISFLDRGNVAMSIINTDVDPIFPGRTRFISMSINVETLNNIVWPETYVGYTVEVYYTASFIRSPAPNLIWTNISTNFRIIDSRGKTDFINHVDDVLLIYNVSAYGISAKYRVLPFFS